MATTKKASITGQSINIADKLMQDKEFIFFTRSIRESIFLRKTQSPFPVTEKIVASSSSLRSLIQRFLTHNRADLVKDYTQEQKKQIFQNVRMRIAQRLIDF